MIRIGVIGLGYWGPNLVRNFQEVAGCSVTMACDTRDDRRQALGRHYPTVVTTDEARKVIESPDVDAVAIATPVGTQFTLAHRALLSGKHVLLEKPMTASVREGEELVDLARSKGCILMVGYTFVYSSSVRRIREMLHAGDLGDFMYFDSVRVNLGIFRPDVNVVWDLAAHDISILLYLVGRDPDRVSVVARNYNQRGPESLAHIILEYSTELIGHIHVSWLSPVKIRRILIGGSNKTIVYDDVAPSEKVRIYDWSVEFSSAEEDPLHPTYRLGDVSIPRLDQREPLLVEAEHFVECIREGTTPLTNGEFGLSVVRVLDACSSSMKSDTGITLL